MTVLGSFVVVAIVLTVAVLMLSRRRRLAPQPLFLASNGAVLHAVHREITPAQGIFAHQSKATNRSHDTESDQGRAPSRWISNYEVLGHLASGGMGHVYLARTVGLGGFERRVVVKTLEVYTDDDDDEFVTMFLDEARLGGAFHHQHIASIYEVGREQHGHYYYVMDYVDGETVEAVWKKSLETAAELPLDFTLTTVAAVASALEYAHRLHGPDGTPLEIVHRDVTPSNVMIGYQGAVKLIDFGIAKSINRRTSTEVGTLKGKIGYVAPEQVLHKRVDHRTDIFALGIMLYELTTRARAFQGNSELDTLERITRGRLVAPSQLVPDYPRGLELIVMKALAIDPDRRFPDARAMGREIEALARTLGVTLGNAAITGVMRQLFQRPGLPHASEEIDTARILAAVPADDEPTQLGGETIDLEDKTTDPIELIRA